MVIFTGLLDRFEELQKENVIHNYDEVCAGYHLNE